MLTDLIHWLSSIHPDELFYLLLPLLLLDAPRYAGGSIFLWIMDAVGDLVCWSPGRVETGQFDYCPTVCVVIAGLNEADTVGHTLNSVWGSYPRTEIIVVDDGSNDGMSEVAHRFAQDHPGVLVLSRTERGGKSSALNFALPFVRADIIVCVDSDSHLGPAAIWEVVQPFADPEVGAVSGNVIVRNPFTNLVTWLQAVEYRRTIFLGRMFASRLDILGIVSGAFGAYRRSAIERVRGWDVGPGEDGDLTLRLRKLGFRVVFVPYGECKTNSPTRWWTLIKQRRRWDWAVVTVECRKHIDLGNIFSPNFRWSNLLLLVDRWLYSLFLPILFWIYTSWLAFHSHEDLGKIFVLNYGCYLVLDLIQFLILLDYSNDRKMDLVLAIALPLMPLYKLLQRLITTAAIIEEMITRRSFRDNFVPRHVRKATWHW